MKGHYVALTVVVFSLLVLSIVYQVTKTPSVIALTPCRPSGNYTYNSSYVKSLLRHASPDGYIILALVDIAFVDMAISLYKTSFQPNGIDNFLFVAVGSRVCKMMNGSLPNPLPCYYYMDDSAADKASTYMSADFIRKMNIRTDMIIEALNANFTVVHTDLDVVFFRNPLPHLKEVMIDKDIATLWDNSAYNAGFVVVRPTWYGRGVYELMLRKTRASKRMDDQTALNHAIAYLKSSYSRTGFAVAVLDRHRYIDGLDYFESSVRRWPLTDDPLKSACHDDSTHCPLVVHNNWIVSREAKIYRFKEHLMWMYDKDGYYSSPTTRYVIYENPVGSWTSDTDAFSAQLAVLTTALAITTVLDRVLILPHFHCFRKSTRIFIDCPLNSILKLTTFDRGFANRYRESSFLQNSLVPDAVRNSISQQYFIATPQTNNNTILEFRNHANMTVVVSRNNTISDDQLLQLLGTDQHRVLSLASLEHVHVTFKSDTQQKAFSETVKASFKRAGYRQF